MDVTQGLGFCTSHCLALAKVTVIPNMCVFVISQLANVLPAYFHKCSNHLNNLGEALILSDSELPEWL